jgi:hypothetical protein
MFETGEGFDQLSEVRLGSLLTEGYPVRTSGFHLWYRSSAPSGAGEPRHRRTLPPGSTTIFAKVRGNYEVSRTDVVRMAAVLDLNTAIRFRNPNALTLWEVIWRFRQRRAVCLINYQLR